MLTDDARYQAVLARDRRFDGVFFVGVHTTGVYCRPICPARTPGRARCAFFAAPAQAEAAGFRACLRCRPELAPGSSTASVDAIDRLVADATRRIDEGAMNDGTADDLARELGVSGRHLRRATEARLGVSPVELAQTRRLAVAKQLLQDSDLSITTIAFAAGFGSVRRFNASFARAMGSSPSHLRRHATRAEPGQVALRLDHRPPYDWARVLGFLRGRAIPGVEQVDGERYRRVVHIGEHVGRIAVTPIAGKPALSLSLDLALLPVLLPLVVRVRRTFDLDARPDRIAIALERDRTLGRLLRARPGLRVPGAFDGFEGAIRALLGQQVSVAGATTLAGRFVAALGRRIDGDDHALGYRFPLAAEVADAGVAAIAAIGLPRRRAEAIHGLAVDVAAGRLDLEHAVDLDAFVHRLVALPGVGPWTAHYLAMRALHHPDAFPAADLVLQKALGGVGARAAEARAAVWQPFRAYAVMHLWTAWSEGDPP